MDSSTALLDGESIVDVYAASSCRTVADFLFSPSFLRHHAVRSVALYSSSLYMGGERDGCLQIAVPDLREHLEEREAGSFLRFLRALPTSLGPACSALYLYGDVQLDSAEELVALCDGIASSLCSLSLLYLDFSIASISSTHHSQCEQESQTATQSITAESAIGDALLSNTSVQILSLCSKSVNFEQALCTALIARSPSPYPIKVLTLYLDGKEDIGSELHRILAGVSDNWISLTSLSIYGKFGQISRFSHKDSERLLGTIPQTNTCLQDLELERIYLPGTVIETLFTSLKQNTQLARLSLLGCKGPDWPSAPLVLDSLRAQGLVSNLNLYGTPLKSQSRAAIEAQLARNAKNLEVLKEEII